jgi:hypothetical protein
MSQEHKSSSEGQPKLIRRSFSAEYKRHIVAEAEGCQHGELGSLLRCEGLTYTQPAVPAVQ